MPNGTHRFDDGRTYPIPTMPRDTHRGGPENVEQYEAVEPFGDEQDAEVLSVVESLDLDDDDEEPPMAPNENDEIDRFMDGLTDGDPTEPATNADNHRVEVIHESDRIITIRLDDIDLSAHLLDGRGDTIDLRATNGDGALVWREVVPATHSGILRAAKEFRVVTPQIPTEALQPILSDLVYKLASASTGDGLVVENLFAPIDSELDPVQVGPFVLHGESSALIGPSGSTKSINAVAVHLVNASGQPIGPHSLTGKPTPGLILDVEANRHSAREIATALGRAHGIEVDDLFKNDMLHYVRLDGPFIGQVESIRRRLHDIEAGFVSVDSVDAARGGDPNTNTGPFYDVLRYWGVSSLSIDHVGLDFEKAAIKTYRALGSVRATNRPRQTWAIKAPREPKSNVVPVEYRLNYVNRGLPGRHFGIDMTFEMTEAGRFETIGLSVPHGVAEVKASKYDRALIAVSMFDEEGTVPSISQITDRTGLTRSTVDSALKNLRGKGYVSPSGQPLGIEAMGRNHLADQWPAGLPDPSDGGAE